MIKFWSKLFIVLNLSIPLELLNCKAQIVRTTNLPLEAQLTIFLKLTFLRNFHRIIIRIHVIVYNKTRPYKLSRVFFYSLLN